MPATADWAHAHAQWLQQHSVSNLFFETPCMCYIHLATHVAINAKCNLIIFGNATKTTSNVLPGSRLPSPQGGPARHRRPPLSALNIKCIYRTRLTYNCAHLRSTKESLTDSVKIFLGENLLDEHFLSEHFFCCWNFFF